MIKQAWLLDYQRTKVNDVLNIKLVNDVLNLIIYPLCPFRPFFVNQISFLPYFH